MPAKGLCLPFEEVLLKQALQKHIHKNDYRDGLCARRPRRNTWGLDVDSDAKKGAANKDAKSGDGDNLDSNSHIVPHVASSPRRPSMEATSLDKTRVAKKANELHGTLDLQLPDFSAGVVRCRLSKCLDTGGKDALTVRRWLSRKCNWKQSPIVGIDNTPLGLDLQTHRAMFGSVRMPSPKRESSRERDRDHHGEDSDDSSSSQEKRPTSSKAPWRGKTVDERAVSAWTCMKHLPPGVVAAIQHTEKSNTTTSYETMQQSKNLLHQTLYSDVATILWARGGAAVAGADKESIKDAPTISSFAHMVPPATATRWQKLLKLQDTAKEDFLDVLARRLAKTLALKPKWFNVLGSGVDRKTLDEKAQLQLIMLTGDATADNYCMDVGHPAKAESSARWLGVLPVLAKLERAASILSASWGFEVNVERLQTVGGALERAESLQLCGGLVASGDHIQRHRRLHAWETCQRGRAGVSSDWALQALTEVGDEEVMEEGDSVRLLARVAEEAEGLHNPDGSIVHFKADSWLGICRLYGLITRPFEATTDQLLEKMNHEEADLFQHFQEAERALLYDYFGPQATVAGPLAEKARAACGPLVLECLIQRLAILHGQRLFGETSPEGIIDELLWRHCGWDTFNGRRLIRRLCRAFNRYAGASGSGALSRARFVGMCNDCGWATQRDHATKQSRFLDIFTNAVSDEPAADFIDFLFILELVANEVVRPTLHQSTAPSKDPAAHHHLQRSTTIEIQSGVQNMWSILEITVAKLSAQGNAKSRAAGQAATVKQKQNAKPKAKALAHSNTSATVDAPDSPMSNSKAGPDEPDFNEAIDEQEKASLQVARLESMAEFGEESKDEFQEASADEAAEHERMVAAKKAEEMAKARRKAEVEKMKHTPSLRLSSKRRASQPEMEIRPTSPEDAHGNDDGNTRKPLPLPSRRASAHDAHHSSPAHLALPSMHGRRNSCPGAQGDGEDFMP